MAVTGAGADIVEVEALPRRYDLFIPKGAITGRAFEGAPDYKKRIFDRFRYSPVRNFGLSSKINEINGTPPPETAEILDFIRQVFSYKAPLERSSLVTDVLLRQLGGGRSSSYVFELLASIGSDRRPILPIVVKFSQLADWAEEVRRYNVYVKWALPHQVRVDVIGSGQSVNWGVVAYSFAHGERGLETFRDILEGGDNGRATVVLDRLFAQGRAFWKATRRDIRYANLAERYIERHYRKRAAWFSEDYGKLRSWSNKHFSKLDMRGATIWKLKDRVFPNLYRFLQRGYIEPDGRRDALWSVVHGDLNPNNIIVSPENDVALIDFRDAGIGHCFEDIICLETCVRLNWPWKNKLGSWTDITITLDSEERIVDGPLADDEPDCEGWNLIYKLRQHAKRIFGRELSGDYEYRLAYYCYRILRIEGLNDIGKKRIVLCGLAAAKRSEGRES